MVENISQYATEILTNSTTGMQYVAVYKETPFFLSIWFFLACLFFLIALAVGFWLWFRISLRNRTNVIIHMPDRTRQTKSYKKFTGNEFKIKGKEKDKDGNYKEYTYVFRPEAVEHGYFGRYIEYDYGISEPLDMSKRMQSPKDNKFYALFSSIMNTQIITDLLLSSKFKKDVMTLLVIILVITGLGLLVNGYIAYATSSKTMLCSLIADNQTINTIKYAMQQ